MHNPDFSRADKSFILVIPRGLQPAENLLFDFFSSLVSRAVRRMIEVGL